jgi:hypothetical protein
MIELGMKGTICARFGIGLFQFKKRRHERFRNIPSAELAEATLVIGLSSHKLRLKVIKSLCRKVKRPEDFPDLTT